MPRAGASRSRSAPVSRRQRSERGQGRPAWTDSHATHWDPWEPFGSNRGGKGAPRGSAPPRWAGPDGDSLWQHDLYDSSASRDWERGLPPRGVGSGRGADERVVGGRCSVKVSNLDSAVTPGDLRNLFSKVGQVANARVIGGGRGSVDFLRADHAAQAVRRYHRHPWKGGRPLNVTCK
mmetsp:Transcript_106823/g.185601  ORF Transcript_106823/g.185601 Transcript_106823/m.185601 type:complete len:178 (-) Transcript_106823:136-669(-)